MHENPASTNWSTRSSQTHASMQRHDQHHWFELAAEGVERGLRSQRRGKKQGSGSSAAATALSWADVVSVYRDIAGKNLWGNENETSLRLLLKRLVQEAVGCLPEGRGSGVAADGWPSGLSRSFMQAADILLPFLQHGPILDVAGHLEPIAAGCLDVIKSAGGQDRSEGGGGASKEEESVRTMVDSAYELLAAVVKRGAALERVQVKKSVLTGVVSKVGFALAGGKAGRRATTSWTPVQMACLRVCLMSYPQALKHVVDGLGEIAAREDLEAFVMLARVGGTAEGWSARGDVVMGSIDGGLEVLLEGLESGEAGDRGQQVGNEYPACGILGISSGENACDVDGTVTDQSHGIQSFKLATFPHLVAHLGNLLRALRVLVTSAFPVPVPMPITRIVGLVRRLLVVDITRIHLIQRVGRTSGQVTSLGVGLPRLQVAALDVLMCMMGTCRGHVVPYMSEVNDLLSGGLEAVLSLKMHGRDEMDVGVVCGLHSAVRESLRVDGVAGAHAFGDSLVELARAHVYVREERAVGGGASGNGHEGVVTGARVEPTSYDDKVLVSMLGVLETLFYKAASAVKHASRLFLEDVVLHVAKTAHQLVQHTQLTTTRDCLRERAVLEASLGALEASVTVPSAHRPTHAAEALRLFRTVGGDSRVAMRAIRSLEIAMHPRSLDMRVKMDNTEVQERHRLGIPSFWLATTSEVVQVVVASPAERPGHVDGQAKSSAGRNEGIEVNESPVDMTDGNDDDDGRKAKKAADPAGANTATAAKRSAIASRIQAVDPSDTTKRFKVSKVPVQNPRAPVDRTEGRRTDAETAEGQKLDDTDEDDFFNLIDSGDET